MTIYDIAKEAGVSASTVSRVINKKGNVKSATRAKVETLLKRYHYAPDAGARALVSGASKTVGILISDIRTMHHTDGIHYLEGELAKLGYCCIIMNTGSLEKSKAEYIKKLSARRVEGTVLIGSTFQTDLVKRTIEEYMNNIPVVILNGALDLPNVYGIIADERGGVRNLVNLMAERGKKHIAFVNGRATPSNTFKQEGYEDGMRLYLPDTECIAISGGPDMDDAKAATTALLTQHPKIDGIIYAVDLLAVGGLEALREKKLRVPEDVAVAGVDNSAYSRICQPKLTSLDNKLLDLSIAVAQTLISALEGKYVTQRIMIFSSIVERETT